MSTSFHVVSDVVADTIKAELGHKYRYSLVPTGALAAALTSQAVLTRIGSKCTVQLPVIAGTFTAATLVLTGLPVIHAPEVAQTFPLVVNDAGTLKVGQAVVATTGVITVSLINAAAFTGGANSGVPSSTLTWVCA